MSIEHRTLALAGMFQSADLVRQVARQGLVDQRPFESSIQSILKLDVNTTEEVYGGLSGVKTGLQVLCRHIGTGTKRNIEVMQYVFGMVLLERKLTKRQEMLEQLKSGLETVVSLKEDYSVTHPNIIVQLAQLYSQTLSTFDYRIKVSGEQRFLENQSNADKIRALLLAGIRSTVLWRQKGGKRWQFLFARGKILKTAQHFLEIINQSSSQ